MDKMEKAAWFAAGAVAHSLLGGKKEKKDEETPEQMVERIEAEKRANGYQGDGEGASSAFTRGFMVILALCFGGMGAFVLWLLGAFFVFKVVGGFFIFVAVAILAYLIGFWKEF